MALSLVQSAFARNPTTTWSSTNISLTSPPTAGNMLVLLVLGNNNLLPPGSSNGPVPGFGTPWVNVQSGADATTINWQLWYRIAGSGESATTTYQQSSNVIAASGFMLLEVSGGAGAPFVNGHGSAGTTATDSIGPLTADANAGDLRYVGLCTTNAVTLSSGPTGWTRVSPTGLGGVSYGDVFWLAQVSASGTPTATMSGASGNAAWVDIIIPLGGQTGATRVTQSGSETWVIGKGTARITQVGSETWVIGNANVRISMVGAEVWMVGQGTMNVSRLGAEVWYSTVPSGVVSRLGAEVWFDHRSIPIPPARAIPVICINT